MLTTGLILILATLGLAQGLFLSFYVFSLKNGNRKKHFFLGLFLLGLTIRIGKSVLNYYVPLENWQNNIGVSGILLASPALWLYGISLFEKNKTITLKTYAHFVPFILFLFFIPFVPREGNFESFWNYGIVVFHLLFYLMASWRYLYRNKLKVSTNLFKWYQKILIGATLIWMHYLGNLLDFTYYYIRGPIFYSCLIYGFSYLFLHQHRLQLQKYSSSPLDKKNSQTLYEQIKMLFDKEEVYLNGKVNLNAIAKLLNVKSREVSQAINENTNHNFQEFVNEYRIKKAIALLKDSTYSGEKIATIAYDSGFGNVTSFNLAFKKKMGVTPSFYRKA